MRLKDFGISKQLNFVQWVNIALVLILGITSYFAADSLWKNTESLHDHPFTTQRALSAIQSDLLKIRVVVQEIVIEGDDSIYQTKLRRLNGYESDIENQIAILKHSYLGPAGDITNAENLLSTYQNTRDKTLELIAAGKIEEAQKRVAYNGICDIQAKDAISALTIINTFADAKADTFYANAKQQRDNTLLLVVLLLTAIIFLTNGLMLTIKRNILPPLKELNNAVEGFEQGKTKIRSTYESENELGILSKSFNNMTERIELHAEEKIAAAAKLMAAQKEINIQGELIKVQEAYYHERQLFEATLSSSGDAVISCDSQGNVSFLNRAAEIITGWEEKEAKGKAIEDIFNIINEYTSEKCENIVKKVIKSGKKAELDDDTILIAKDGSTIPVEDSAAPIFQENGDIIGAVLVFRDVSDKRQKLKNIEYLSYHDKLTGLYNRRFYEEEIMRIDTKRNLPLTIAMGDLNGLKLINDSFGHAVGDELLIKAGEAIKSGCRNDDIIARLGGDEFIIILPKTNVDETEIIINRIKSIMSMNRIKGLEISIAFGHGTKESEDKNVQDIFKLAEDDMYRQKLYESASMRSKTIDLILNSLYEKNPREMIHSKRVSQICEAIAREMQFDSEDINQIRVAGLMHDIGKIAIDEKILNKAGKLTEAEYEEIKRHSEIGYRVLNSANEFSDIGDAVLEHHERWDGSGYPKGIKGEEISVQARIISIADAFEVMTGERIYRKPISRDEAVEEIRRNAGTQFDPDIAEIFIQKVATKIKPF